MLDAVHSVTSVTRAVGIAVQRSLLDGPDVIGDLSDLIKVLKRHPDTKQLVKEGPRCFVTTLPAARKMYKGLCCQGLLQG